LRRKGGRRASRRRRREANRQGARFRARGSCTVKLTALITVSNLVAESLMLTLDVEVRDEALQCLPPFGSCHR